MSGTAAPLDFIDQRWFQRLAEHDVEVPPDHLGHVGLSRSLLRAARALPSGAVIAVEAPWGRGKTDVLMRVAASTWTEDVDPRVARRAVWVNPWRYGRADLLTPIVAELVRRAKVNSGKAEDLKKGASIVLRAGLRFGLRAAATAVPFGELVRVGADEVDELIAKLVSEDPDDVDPVEAMADEFKKLVEAALPAEEREAGGRLLICIDDLDRCLPDRQVCLLQAIRFLLSAGAPATFVVAIDPTLAREAVRTHYQNAALDVDRYLDKLFDLRVAMSGLARESLTALVSDHLARVLVLDASEVSLGKRVQDWIGEPPGDLATYVGKVLHETGNANPRVARRLMDRLLVAAVGSDGLAILLRQEDRTQAVAAWLLIAERWPEVRRHLQEVGLRDGWTTLSTHLGRLWDFRYSPDAVAKHQNLPPARADAHEHELRRAGIASPSALVPLMKLVAAAPKSGQWVHTFERLDPVLVAAGV